MILLIIIVDLSSILRFFFLIFLIGDIYNLFLLGWVIVIDLKKNAFLNDNIIVLEPINKYPSKTLHDSLLTTHYSLGQLSWLQNPDSDLYNATWQACSRGAFIPCTMKRRHRSLFVLGSQKSFLLTRSNSLVRQFYTQIPFPPQVVWRKSQRRPSFFYG